MKEDRPVDEICLTRQLCVRFPLTVDEVALLLPDEKGVTQSRKDEASQDLTGIGVST